MKNHAYCLKELFESGNYEELGKYISDMALDEDERKKAFEKADMITRLAKQMINNADVILRTDKLLAEGKMSDSTIERVVGGK